MKYISTKYQSNPVNLKTAVLSSLPNDGGLYVPESLPRIPPELHARMHSLTFSQTALEIAQLMLGDDVPHEVLVKVVSDAFNFPVEIHQITDSISFLELFHGPTCAFKDFAARFMAHLMAYFLQEVQQPLTILVATSGDTGGAVADAFNGIDGIRVVILYPYQKVSALQAAQLNSYGDNVTALAIQGSFDQCQALVKQAFLDETLHQSVHLASANSINIARLIPQMFYYVYAAYQMAHVQRPLTISVPSGNFGNLTAAILAQRIGAPITHFIAACNINDTVPRYFKTGVYEPQAARHTLSNAMDVTDPSNFQRLMHLYNNDSDALKQEVTALSFSDKDVTAAIKDCFNSYNYTMDPHTAIGYLALKAYALNPQQGLIAATAHPAKFLDAFDAKHQEYIPFPIQLSHLLNDNIKETKVSPDYQSVIKYIHI